MSKTLRRKPVDTFPEDYIHEQAEGDQSVARSLMYELARTSRRKILALMRPGGSHKAQDFDAELAEKAARISDAGLSVEEIVAMVKESAEARKEPYLSFGARVLPYLGNEAKERFEDDLCNYLSELFLDGYESPEEIESIATILKGLRNAGYADYIAIWALFAPGGEEKRRESLNNWRFFKKGALKALQEYRDTTSFEDMENELLEKKCLPGAKQKLLDMKGTDERSYQMITQQLAFAAKAFFVVDEYGKKNRFLDYKHGSIDCNDHVPISQVVSLLTNQQIFKELDTDQHVSLLLTDTNFVLDTYDGKVCLLQEHVFRRYNEQRPSTGSSTYFYRFGNSHYIIDNGLDATDHKFHVPKPELDPMAVPGFRLVKEKPYVVPPYEDLASLLVTMSLNYERQQKAYIAQKIYEELVPKIVPNHEDALYNSAIVSRDNGQLKTSQELLLKTLEVNPWCAKAYAELGSHFQNQNDLDSAKKNYQQCLNIDPFDSLSHNHLGIIFERERNFEKAEEHYRKAIQYAPSNQAAYNNLGNFLFHKGNKYYKESKEMLAQSLKLNPLDKNANLNMARLLTESKEKNPDSFFIIKRYFETALFNGYEDSFLWTEYGNFLRNSMDLFTASISLNHYFSESIKAYMHAIKIDDKNANTWFGLGWIYQFADNFIDLEKAKECYENSINLNDTSGAYTNLACIYERNGDDFFQQGRFLDARISFEKAVHLQKKALKIHPQNRSAIGNLPIFEKKLQDTLQRLSQIQ